MSHATDGGQSLALAVNSSLFLFGRKELGVLGGTLYLRPHPARIFRVNQLGWSR